MRVLIPNRFEEITIATDVSKINFAQNLGLFSGVDADFEMIAR